MPVSERHKKTGIWDAARASEEFPALRPREPIPTLVDEWLEGIEPVVSDTLKDRCIFTVMRGRRFAGLMRLSGQTLTIGRDENIDGRIDDAFVSRRHARVSRRDGNVWIEDLGSTNGTFVGGHRIRSERRLNDGDYVRLSRDVLLRCGLHDEISEQSLLQLYESSTTDPVTHAHNRRYFELQLEAEVSFAERHETPLVLLVLDVDGFKKINDTHGHATGDAALYVLAEAIRRTLRPEDVFARFGGDEFVLLARGIERRNGEILGERIRHLVAELPLSNVRPGVRVTVSVGAAARGASSACSAPLLVAMADRAMYRAKSAGGDRVVSVLIP